jgi:hypothetical protein
MFVITRLQVGGAPAFTVWLRVQIYTAGGRCQLGAPRAGSNDVRCSAA